MLEFVSVVWSPYQRSFIYDLKRIRDRFMRVVGIQLGMPCRGLRVSELVETLGLETPEISHNVHGMLWLYKLLNKLKDYPALLKLSSEYRETLGHRNSLEVGIILFLIRQTLRQVESRI
ncbi:hypothetical protein J6590_075585 [Homalodisca vitripennis]|nr:hypothetical protein J6590_075585 [Homalodisca vitripennis]